jgi:hypothetical protein
MAYDQLAAIGWGGELNQPEWQKRANGDACLPRWLTIQLRDAHSRPWDLQDLLFQKSLTN